MDDEFEMLCAMATFALCGLSTYTEEGAKSLDAEEAQHIMPVILAFQQMVEDSDDEDDDSDFRVDDTLY